MSRLSSTQVGTLDRNGAFGWKNIDREKAVRFVDNSWSIKLVWNSVVEFSIENEKNITSFFERLPWTGACLPLRCCKASVSQLQPAFSCLSNSRVFNSSRRPVRLCAFLTELRILKCTWWTRRGGGGSLTLHNYTKSCCSNIIFQRIIFLTKYHFKIGVLSSSILSEYFVNILMVNKSKFPHRRMDDQLIISGPPLILFWQFFVSGFHLSGEIVPGRSTQSAAFTSTEQEIKYKVSVSFDRWEISRYYNAGGSFTNKARECFMNSLLGISCPLSSQIHWGLAGFVEIMSSTIQIDKETRESILSNELVRKLLKLGSHRKSATPWPPGGSSAASSRWFCFIYPLPAWSPGSIR